MKIIFELQGLPVRTNNAKANWKARYREATAWKKKVVNAVILNKLQPEKPFAKAKLTLTRFSSVEPDYDGLVSSFKHTVDGLIAADVIENDKMSNIGQPTYLWEQAPPGKGKIRVEVEAA